MQFAAPMPDVDPKKLSQFLPEYIEHQTNPLRLEGKGWKPPTREVNEKTLNNFITYCDKSAATFNREDAEKYIKILRVIPMQFNNIDRSGRFQEDLTIEMMLDDNFDSSIYKNLAPATMRIYISTVVSFLTLMLDYKEVNSLQSAIKALKLAKENMSTKTIRRSFTQEELKILFQDDNPAKENYVKGFKLKNSSKSIVAPNIRYWLPL